ncbi:Regulatory-associated protein of TOR 1 [Zea mays]|uniref:Regulatory-associated protein of TOR 1 n=1 Tax=Zea mays TaxID=4577 RepID=A0A3L6FU62_MAIZE|nr:Regulatory-associated protein of TOR 1 [Zea mays]
MALGDLMASRFGHSSSSPSPSLAPVPPLPHHHHNHHQNHVADDLPVASGPEPKNGLEVPEVEKPAPEAYLPQVVVLCDYRHEGIDEATIAAPSTSGLVSNWRPKDRVMDVMQFADAVPSA